MSRPMDHLQGVLDSHRRLESRGGVFCQISKILSAGSMIGSAILFPLAHAEGLWFRAVTLSIFVLTAVVFHGLHIRPFVRIGPYSVPVMLVLLLLAVLAGGPSKTDLVPWMPLFIVCSSLVTVGIYELTERPCPCGRNVETPDEFSGVSVDSWSDDPFRAAFGSQKRRPPSQSNRFNPLYFARCGPSSQYYAETEAGSSDISLSSTGQCRAHWDPLTRGYFTSEHTPEPNEELPGQSPIGIGFDREPVSVSDHASNRSNYPLLGPL